MALTRTVRLFIKNVAGCKPERTSITGETCPVVVFETLVQEVEDPSNGGPNYEALKVA